MVILVYRAEDSWPNDWARLYLPAVVRVIGEVPGCVFRLKDFIEAFSFEIVDECFSCFYVVRKKEVEGVFNSLTAFTGNGCLPFPWYADVQIRDKGFWYREVGGVLYLIYPKEAGDDFVA